MGRHSEVLDDFRLLDSAAPFRLVPRAAHSPGNVAWGSLGKVLDPELARKLSAAVGLRNRIAHEYGALDLAKVFKAVRRDLGDLDAFAAAAVRLPQS